MKKRTLCIIVAGILAALVPAKRAIEKKILPDARGPWINYYNASTLLDTGYSSNRRPDDTHINKMTFTPRSSIFSSDFSWYDILNEHYRIEPDGNLVLEEQYENTW